MQLLAYQLAACQQIIYRFTLELFTAVIQREYSRPGWNVSRSAYTSRTPPGGSVMH
jgi:hypothetical protein